mmetsp:Transcript_35536/g.92907  ORF Transcript_35536/g.92907 Transcript_35536/m.92907 type:complete len:283 (-) Transcript_35536:943-1791(-)
MRYKAQAPQGIAGAPIADVAAHLVSQLAAHFQDVTLRVLLISTRAQENCIRVEQGNVVLHEAHVEGIALKAVHKYEEMGTPVRLGCGRDASLDFRCRAAGGALLNCLLGHVALLEHNGMNIRGWDQRQILHRNRLDHLVVSGPSKRVGHAGVRIPDSLVGGNREILTGALLAENGLAPPVYHAPLPCGSEHGRDIRQHQRHHFEHLLPHGEKLRGQNLHVFSKNSDNSTGGGRILPKPRGKRGNGDLALLRSAGAGFKLHLFRWLVSLVRLVSLGHAQVLGG